MVSKIIIFVLYFFLSLQLRPSKSQTWIRAGFHLCSDNESGIADINSSLFTHLICGFAIVDSTSYQLSFLEEKQFSTFTQTVKQQNPSITTLLSILAVGDADYVAFDAHYFTFPLMVSNPSYRKSFIDSSINIARLYGFQGLELAFLLPYTRSEMFNMSILFEEWRAAIDLEGKASSQPQLILTARVPYSPSIISWNHPIESIQQHLNWVYVRASHDSSPLSINFTSSDAALYDPDTIYSTDYGIKAWLLAGLSANKMVLGIPYYGFAWTLVNPKDNGIGAPAKGPAITKDGAMKYKEIKNYIKQHDPNVQIIYNETYVVNYCTIETSWIAFDDVEAVRAKVSYAKEMGLLGYYASRVSYDDNCLLSQAAASVEVEINNSSIPEDNKNNSLIREGNKTGHNKRRLIAIVLCTTAAVILLLGIFVICYCCRTKFKGMVDSAKQSYYKVNKAAAAADFNSNISRTETTDMMIPKKPAFSKQNERNKLTVQFEGYSGSTSSVKDIAVLGMVGR